MKLRAFQANLPVTKIQTKSKSGSRGELEGIENNKLLQNTKSSQNVTNVYQGCFWKLMPSMVFRKHNQSSIK